MDGQNKALPNFIFILLLSPLATAQAAADSPFYNVSETLLYWNGNGYLPVIEPGTGDIILASVG
ncbi:hypothetical protein [Thermococcus piezophilus]|uniref:Uncharacterized protein n=1 Tax=Thermococcus piezophilus TaxID=1712654 RepID=A0A172WFA7_9EURY|nr:hypothetical protein [Thermococcus piezophilus]ANF22075.1 hypothetical protein A7C91_01875 [Thermococcus piezophilus]